MRRLFNRFGAGMGILLLPAVVAYAGEEEIPLDSVPKPVMDAVKARFNDAEVTGAAKEKDDDKLVYEVSLNLKGQKIDMILTPEGEIVLFEKRIAFKDLPAAVAKAFEDKYPKATYKKVEEVVSVENKNEKTDYYEALLVTADKSEKGEEEEEKLEVKSTPEGKIVSVEEAGSD